ncbi:hypothetical protein B7494_g3653 [Chlorociboria aeruginascens]|nr:hypothetical protein B7494_g3653 [Chlorociboria aeruginascens]
MSLTILSDSNVKDIIENLAYGELKEMQESMSKALHEYATGNQGDDACADQQPGRTVMSSAKYNTTSLFMPSRSSRGIGMKGSSSQIPLLCWSDTSTAPQGALTLMTPFGQPFGFINAEELTAFRTALASSILLSRRTKVKTLTVFGAGKQAYWHIRLALKLRGPTVRTVYIINREFNDRLRDLLKSLVSVDPDIKIAEGWWDTKFAALASNYGEYARMEKEQIRAADVIICTTPSTEPLFDEKILTSTEGRRRPRLIIAIGSYTKDMIELPKEILLQAVKIHGGGHHFHKHAEEGGVVVVDTLDGCFDKSGEIIQAGLTPKQIVELGELVMLEELHNTPEASSAIDDSQDSTETSSPLEMSGGKSIAHALRENSWESEASPKSPSRKSSFSGISRRASLVFRKRAESSSSSTQVKKQDPEQDQMSRWLSGGNVIYKSVGLGLMDLVAGTDLVRLAKEKGVGVTVEGF